MDREAKGSQFIVPIDMPLEIRALDKGERGLQLFSEVRWGHLI